MTPPGRERLFDLSTDPGEQRDLATAHPERVESLREGIDALLARPAPWGSSDEVELDAATLEELRALGYLGVGAVSE